MRPSKTNLRRLHMDNIDAGSAVTDPEPIGSKILGILASFLFLFVAILFANLTSLIP